MASDLILLNGRFTTLDKTNPSPQAVAIEDGIFSAVGSSATILALVDQNTKVIDLKGRRVIPGLIDSHSLVHLGRCRASVKELQFTR